MASSTALPVVPLGSQGLRVSAQGLGCMGMSTAYKRVDGTAQSSEADNMAVIQRALELGVTFLDTSDAYGPFHNEELIGEYTNTPRIVC